MQNENHDEHKMFVKVVLSTLLQFGADSVQLDTVKASEEYHEASNWIPKLEALVARQDKMLSGITMTLAAKIATGQITYVDVDALRADLQNEITAKIHQKFSTLKALMRSLKVREEINND